VWNCYENKAWIDKPISVSLMTSDEVNAQKEREKKSRNDQAEGALVFKGLPLPPMNTNEYVLSRDNPQVTLGLTGR